MSKDNKNYILHEGKVFESNKWEYLIAVPIIALITIEAVVKKGVCSLVWNTSPETNSYIVDRKGTDSRFVRDYSASWRVLHFLYNYEKGKKYKFISNWLYDFWGTLDNFWVNNRNAQAVRNRLVVAKHLLRQEIIRLAEEREVVEILSVASGSAQSVIEVIAQLRDELDDTTVNAHLVDLKKGALDKAKELARRNDVDEHITVEQTTVGNLLSDVDSENSLSRRHSAPRRDKLMQVRKNGFRPSPSDMGLYKPDLIEMIGFLDYLTDNKARRYIGKILNILPEDGVFMTCNVFRNIEAPFLWFVVDWPMKYRTKEELAKLPINAGFGYVGVHIEPLKIHGISVSKKTNS